MPKRISRNGRAARLNEQANACKNGGDEAAALDLYAQAARVQPLWAAPWFNIGLIHKYRGDWAASLSANQEALRRDPEHEGAIWNAGIAATALGQWRLARAMWRRYGIDMADSDAPCDMGASLTPIRVNPREAPEVLWADRIDPARAIIRSIPTEAAQRRYGDLLLHDGAPNGYRRLHGQEMAVFDELQVLAPSAFATWELQVEGLDAEQADALAQRFTDADVPAENWSTSLHLLCRACSEGRPDDDPGHAHPPATGAADAVVTLGLALHDSADAAGTVNALMAAMPGARVRGLRCVLPAVGAGAPA
ncbi:MAG: tetratricopeptide repeat protein [Pseudomonadota bacterium]|nr:tetratricopeptide repeat protein [Pseudomonadota bacterium]